MVMPPKDGYADKFGRKWFLTKPQLCPVCGQPDDYSDCNHHRLTDDEVKILGGKLPEHKKGGEMLLAIIKKDEHDKYPTNG